MRISRRLKCYNLFLTVYFSLLGFILLSFKSLSQDIGFNAFKIYEIYKDLSVRINDVTVIDNTGMYKIFSVTQSQANASKFDVTLVSQCSSNHIHWIGDLCYSWQGPISVAVFTELEYIEWTLWEISRLIHCSNGKDLKLNLVVPNQKKYIKNFNYGTNMIYDSDRSVSCKFLHNPDIKRNFNGTVPYPINLLRNIAKSTSTDYVFIIDIDMIPSFNLRNNFLKTISSGPLKKLDVVYVVPAFEMKTYSSIPMNKRELIKQVEAKNARPFYFVPCRNCQRSTQFIKWLMKNQTEVASVLYEVQWAYPWEPFFIGKNNLPDYDERFKQYGLNRVSQICELHVAGYKFLLLDNVFLIHRGFKTKNDFHITKNVEMDANRKLFGQFKEELKYKYSNSKRKC